MNVSPSGALKTGDAMCAFKSEINPLDPVRDQLPDNKQIHEMILTYTMTNPQTARQPRSYPWKTTAAPISRIRHLAGVRQCQTPPRQRLGQDP